MSNLPANHGDAVAFVRSVFGPDAKVLHGKFMAGSHAPPIAGAGVPQVLVGSCIGEELVAGGEREALTATVIVIEHRRGRVVNVSPEDFLEDPMPFFPSKAR